MVISRCATLSVVLSHVRHDMLATGRLNDYAKGSIMTHFVVGLGDTKWHGAVSDKEYDEVDA